MAGRKGLLHVAYQWQAAGRGGFLHVTLHALHYGTELQGQVRGGHALHRESWGPLLKRRPVLKGTITVWAMCNSLHERSMRGLAGALRHVTHSFPILEH
eukprot:scaffold157058_cov16-Tisochrysis_lutea.AAC.1